MNKESQIIDRLCCYRTEALSGWHKLDCEEGYTDSIHGTVETQCQHVADRSSASARVGILRGRCSSSLSSKGQR